MTTDRKLMPVFALAAVAVIAVLLAHGTGLRVPFHFDDFHSIKDNVWLRDLAHVPRYFTDVSVFSPLEENRAYRPILLVGFALSYALGGGVPWAFHAVSLALHAFGVVVLGLLLERLVAAQLRGASGGALSPDEVHTARGLALGGALLLAVHPLFSEAVVYVSARSSLQAAVLAWTSLWLYVVAREDRRPGLFALSALVLLLAMGTKIIAMTVPALVLAWELVLGPERGDPRRIPRAAWVWGVAPLFVVGLGFTAFHEWWVGAHAHTNRSAIAPFSYLLTETQVWLRFIGLFVWPEDLCADLTMPWATSPWAGPVARAILLNVAIVLVALRGWRARPLVALGVVWFYVALSPTNSFMPLSEPASEHRVYIAAPGLILALTGLLLPWARALASGPRLATRGALVALVVALALVGGATRARLRVWMTEEALWADVLRQSPDNARAQLNHGLALMGRGDFGGARAAFERCATAWPNWLFCPVNQAALAVAEHQPEAAERYAERARQLAPDNIYVLLWSGRVDRARGRWADAEARYTRALQVAPGHVDGRLGRALAALMLGRVDEAAPELEALRGAAWNDPQGAWALGWLADRSGDAERALAAYERALALDPRDEKARYNAAVLHQKAGRLDRASSLYAALMDEGKGGPDTWFNLSLVYEARGEHERAEALRERLRREAPGYLK